MTKCMIASPSAAMVIAEDDFAAVSDDAHAVVQAAKDAGVCVFGAGQREDVAPVEVSADGTVVEGPYPETRRIEGGHLILEMPSRRAAACRCDQELCEFTDDPQS